MENIQDELKKWAKEVVEVYNPTKRSYYTQSDLTKITESPEILILGINPGSTGIAKEPITADVFLKGNKNFCDREKSWHLWKNLRKILSAGGVDYLLDNESRFVFSNVYHCDTPKAKDLSKDITDEQLDEQLVNLTIELIKTLCPSRVLCLGKNDCWKVLEKASNMKTTELIKGELSYAKIDEIPIYGIKHTSSFYTNEESVMIGKVLAALFNGKVDHDADKIAIQFKDEIKAFKDRRNQLKPDNIRNYMVESAFDKYSHLQKWEIDNKWSYVTDDIIARVASNGYVNVRHSCFDSKENYSKHLHDNKYQHREELIECLKEFGYELTKKASETSLGQKPFNKYKDADKGPQYIVLSILEEFAELKSKFEKIFGRT